MEATKRNQDEGIPVPYSKKKIMRVKGMVNSWYYFGLAGEIGFGVALPIAGGAIIGTQLDWRLHSYPQYTIILLFVGIVLSMINFVVIVKTILKQKN